MTEKSFEEALSRLEEIVRIFEGSAEMPLEEMIASYEEGLGLAKFCQQKLDEAELKIEELTAKNE